MLGRRRLAALLGVSLAPTPLRADDFPARPVSLVVPFPPGTPGDMLARLVARSAATALGSQPILIENRTVANGVPAAAAVARAEPDGYTLLLATPAQVTVPAAILRTPNLDPARDLAPVAYLADMPMVLVVSAASTIGSLSDFVGQARDRRGALNYASTGVGTLSHLVMENLKLVAGIEVEHVPYRGNAAALTDLHAGQVQAAFVTTAVAAPMLGSGKFRALAVTGHGRALSLPDVPTLAEAGLPGAEVPLWAGIMAPAGLPRVVVRQLERAFDEAVASPDVRERLRLFGADPVGQGARALAEAVAADLAVWRRVAAATGLTMD